MENKFTLIVPMLNNSEKYQNIVPIEFQYNNQFGKMNCIISLEGINTNIFSDVYFVILKKHEIKYNISNQILLNIKNNDKLTHLFSKIHFKIIDLPTRSQAETIHKTIVEENITGSIFIKDTDNACISNDIKPCNSVLVFNLEDINIVDPQHKSYVAVDDMNFIVNIIEKRVISNLFNCGGYSFLDAQDFIDAYEGLLKHEDILQHMYISHIIYWLIMYKKIKFRPIHATEYSDFEILNSIK